MNALLIEFLYDIVKFYSEPENAQALEAYRKEREAQKGGETDEEQDMPT